MTAKGAGPQKRRRAWIAGALALAALVAALVVFASSDAAPEIPSARARAARTAQVDALDEPESRAAPKEKARAARANKPALPAAAAAPGGADARAAPANAAKSQLDRDEPAPGASAKPAPIGGADPASAATSAELHAERGRGRVGTGAAAKRSEHPGRLYVRLLAEESGQPLRRASVVVSQAGGEPAVWSTDEQGGVEMTFLDDAVIDLVFHARGRVRQRDTGRAVGRGIDGRIDVSLARGIVVGGTVSADGTSGLAGASVVAYRMKPWCAALPFDDDPWPVAETTTDAQGAYRIDSLPRAEECVLVVTAPGRAQATSVVPANPDVDAAFALEIVLRPGRTLDGRVVDAEGKPAPGVTVLALAGEPAEFHDSRWLNASEQAEWWFLRALGLARDGSRASVGLRRARTDTDGRFAIDGVLPSRWDAGAHTLLALDPARGRSLVSTRTPKEGTVELALRGRVRASFEVAGAGEKETVVLSPLLPWETWPAQTLSRAKPGGGEIDVGLLIARIVPSEHAPVSGWGKQKDDDRTRWIVTLDAGRNLSGRVVDDRGQPVRGASVEWKERLAVSDENGAFEMSALPLGEVVLGASAEGHAPAEVTIPYKWPPGAVATVTLRRKAALRVTLVLPPDTAIPTWRRLCFAQLQSENRSLHPQSDDQFEWAGGRAEIADVGPGLDTCIVYVPGCRLHAFAVSTRPGETADKGELRLQPAVRLRGRVVDQDGLAIADAEVTSTLSASGQFVLSRLPVLHVFTDDAGVFEIPLLAGALTEKGRLAGVDVASQVSASASGMSDGGPDTSKAGDVVITLRRPSSFAGKLLGADPRNEPTQVSLFAQARPLATVVPAKDGRFEAWLAEPPTTIVVRFRNRATKTFDARGYTAGTPFEIDLGK